MSFTEDKKRRRYGKLKKKSDYSRLSMGFETSERAAKRVIAPYVNIVRKGRKAAVKPELDDKYFTFYLKKKPSLLTRHLTEFMDESVDLTMLSFESVETLKSVTGASGVRLYLVDQTTNQIYIASRQATSYGRRVCWKIEEGKSLAAHVAATMECVMLDDIIADYRFPDGIPYTDATIKSVICVPIVTPASDCYAVIELFRDIMEPPFRKVDLKITINVASWMGASIHMNQQRVVLSSQQRLNDCLAELTKCYFADTVLFDKMISEIVSFAKSTVNAERTTFFMIDPYKDDLVGEIFDEGVEKNDDVTKRNLRIRFGKERAIAGMVARTGVCLNIKDAYNDPRFMREFDERSGFITRSIMCMPVMGAEGILGVVQAVNKRDGAGFTKQDENIFKTFSLYCALALHYTRVFKKNKAQDAKCEVTLGILKRHVMPCDHQLDWTLNHPDFYELPQAIQNFSWYISLDYISHMPRIAIHMILTIAGEDAMDSLELTKFVLTLRNFYRTTVEYHNWEHGFNVCHCMFNLLLRSREKFTDIEQKALIVATLGHDVDHGGVTNNFLVTTNSVMSQLYETSPWESHHYTVTMLILSEIHIYKDITAEEFKAVDKVINHAILATDLANYFKVRAKFMPIVNEGLFDWDNPEHKSMITSIMMTTCDLSGQCKPYNVAMRITRNIYSEFYRQGDEEKKMGLQPLSLMDRQKQNLVPEDQIQFINVLVLPCCDLLRKCVRDTDSLYNMAENLREYWSEVIRNRDERCWRQEDSVVCC